MYVGRWELTGVELALQQLFRAGTSPELGTPDEVRRRPVRDTQQADAEAAGSGPAGAIEDQVQASLGQRRDFVQSEDTYVHGGRGSDKGSRVGRRQSGLLALA